MSEWNQHPGESYEDWKWRLLLAKTRHETHGLSWTDIASMLGLSYTEEHLRKEMHGIALYDEYLRGQRGIARDDDLQAQMDSLERAKIQAQDQRRMLRKDLREWARADHLREEVVKAIRELEPLKIRPQVEGTELVFSNLEGILLLSDWHVGMVTDNLSNTYNTTVFRERLGEVARQTIETCRLNSIGRLHMMCLGDLVHGLIHVTARIQSEEDVVRQCMDAAEGLCSLIGSILDAGIGIKLYWSRGNHDRVNANMKESICKESFADLILWYLQARLEGVEGIEIVPNTQDDEIIMAEVCGQKICAVHGHKDKPDKAVRNMVAVTRSLPDYVFLGHFHSSAEREIDGATVIVNGSLCGVDDYAHSLRCTGKPSQSLLIMSERGIVARHNLIL